MAGISFSDCGPFLVDCAYCGLKELSSECFGMPDDSHHEGREVYPQPSKDRLGEREVDIVKRKPGEHDVEQMRGVIDSPTLSILMGEKLDQFSVLREVKYA